MKKMSFILTALALCTSLYASVVQAAENPTCILMKFTDDTRFDKIESAASLSDLVMEKLLVSGKFNLKETKPIDGQIEALLYDEKLRELQGVRSAIYYGTFCTKPSEKLVCSFCR